MLLCHACFPGMRNTVNYIYNTHSVAFAFFQLQLFIFPYISLLAFIALKIWLILLLKLRKGCWKVSSSFLYFPAGPGPAVIVWFNRISMHWCLQKLAWIWHCSGTVTSCFPFPGILLNNSKKLSIKTDWY